MPDKLIYIINDNPCYLEIINVNDPSNPTHVGSELIAPAGGSLTRLHIDGDYAYILGEDNIGRMIDICDVSDKTNPTSVGRIHNGDGGAVIDDRNLYTFVSMMIVEGNYIYNLTDTDYLEIIDISDKSNPIHAGKIHNGDGGAVLNNPRSFKKKGNYVFVMCRNSIDSSAALESIDVSDPTNPVHADKLVDGVGGIDFPYASELINIDGDYLYFTADDAHNLYLIIIDISDPTNMNQLCKKYIGARRGVLSECRSAAPFIKDNIACCIRDRKFVVVNVTNKSNPSVIGSIEYDDPGVYLVNIKDYKVLNNNYLFTVCYNAAGTEAFESFDMNTVSKLGDITNGEGGASLNRVLSMKFDGNYAYLADYSGAALEIIDVSDPSNPQHLAKLSNGGSVHLEKPWDIDIPPVADFSYNQRNLFPPRYVDFTDLSVAGTPITKWNWQTPRETKTEQNPSCILCPGDNLVTLQVEDEFARTDSVSKNVNVESGTFNDFVSYQKSNRVPAVINFKMQRNV